MAPSASTDYQVIARRYRPQGFSEVVGQETVVRSLQNDLRDNRIGHAYLFSGPRGVGKTSMARIFAKALNCVKGPTHEPCGACVHCQGIRADSDLDVIEVDAATHNKREETEQLLDGIDRATFSARYKIYIIDEVHMFSTPSFNVLLKRLEEPPPRVVFILATTNPEKIPDTVISRCRHCVFERIETTGIMEQLGKIAEREGAKFAAGEREAILEAVALASEGGMRDAQVALDQLISLSEGVLTMESARQLLGIVEAELLERLLVAVAKRDTVACLLIVNELVNAGRDLARFGGTFLAYLRDAMLLKAGAPPELLRVARSHAGALGKVTAGMSMPFLLNVVNQFVELEEKFRSAAPPRFMLEFALIRITAIHPRLMLESYSAGGPPPGGPDPDGPTKSARVETQGQESSTGRRSDAAGASGSPAMMVAEPPPSQERKAKPVAVIEMIPTPPSVTEQGARGAAPTLRDYASAEGARGAAPARPVGEAPPPEAPPPGFDEVTDESMADMMREVQTRMTPHRAMSFEEALDEYPEFRSALELVQEHLGGVPVAFDGKSVRQRSA